MIIIDLFSLTFYFKYQKYWREHFPNLHKTFIISPLAAKLYGIILENNICILLESQEKGTKSPSSF
jgi:hypothetical protein